MTDPSKLAEELERLHTEATPGPWSWDNRGEKCNDIHIGTACSACSSDSDELLSGYFDDENAVYIDHVAEVRGGPADARLIVDTINSLPTIIALLRELASLREQQQKAVEEERKACIAELNMIPCDEHQLDEGFEPHEAFDYALELGIEAIRARGTPAADKKEAGK